MGVFFRGICFVSQGGDVVGVGWAVGSFSYKWRCVFGVGSSVFCTSVPRGVAKASALEGENGDDAIHRFVFPFVRAAIVARLVPKARRRGVESRPLSLHYRASNNKLIPFRLLLHVL